MFVLWSRGMISSEDVIGLSVCIPGLLGGVSPAHIWELDLPQRRALVPASPAASVGRRDWQRGEMGKDVLTNPAGAFSCLTVWAEDLSPLYIHPRSLRPVAPTGCLFAFTAWRLPPAVIPPPSITHILTSPLLSHHQPAEKQMGSKKHAEFLLLWPFDVNLEKTLWFLKLLALSHRQGDSVLNDKTTTD